MPRLNFNIVQPSQMLAAQESDRFGFKIGKLEVGADAEIAQNIKQARREGLDMVIARVASSLHKQIHAIEAQNGVLCDSLLVYDRAISPKKSLLHPRPHILANAITTQACANDRKDVEKLASRVFYNYDGHFHADPRLDRHSAVSAYAEWAGKLTEPEAERCAFVVRRNGVLCAFASVKKNGPHVADCPLFFVAPEFQGHGIFLSLVSAAIDWAATNECTVIEYSTQVTNTAAQRGIAKLGFALSRSYYTFHVWI